MEQEVSKIGPSSVIMIPCLLHRIPVLTQQGIVIVACPPSCLVRRDERSKGSRHCRLPKKGGQTMEFLLRGLDKCATGRAQTRMVHAPH
jgi:hypothetical protein